MEVVNSESDSYSTYGEQLVEDNQLVDTVFELQATNIEWLFSIPE